MYDLTPFSISEKPMDQKPIISVRDAKKIYRVGSVDVHALRGVDLEIMPGEFFLLFYRFPDIINIGILCAP